MGHDHSSDESGHGHDAQADLPEGLKPKGATESGTALGVTLLVMVFGVTFVVVALSLYYESYKSQAQSNLSEGWQTYAQEYLTSRDRAEFELSDAPKLLDDTAGRVRLPLTAATDAVIAEYRTLRAGGEGS